LLVALVLKHNNSFRFFLKITKAQKLGLGPFLISMHVNFLHLNFFCLGANGKNKFHCRTRRTKASKPKPGQHFNPVSLPPDFTFPSYLVTPSNLEVIVSTNSKVWAPKLIKLGQ
jgi:hypothetical protein